MNEESEDAPFETLDVLSFALVELRDGSQVTDVVVQRSLESTRDGEAMEPEDDDIRECSHKKFASEMGYAHYLVKPPASATPMLPIPPGTVRGKWVTLALTSSDNGKIISIAGNVITVDGRKRIVEWEDKTVPTNVQDKKIAWVGEYSQGGGAIKLEGGNRIWGIPYLAARDTQQEVDLAFAMVMDKTESGSHETRFFMPVATDDTVHELMDASNVTFGDQCFRCFVGALRA